MVAPTPNNAPPSFFKELIRLVTRSFWLKFLSLLFAIVLFFIVRTDKEVVYERMAKVKIVTMPNMTVIGSRERFLNVSVRIQNSLFSVPPTDNELSGEIDVSTTSSEKLNVKVTRENFPNLPKHYTLFIERPYIEIETDKLIEKTVPIQVVLKGDPLPGLAIAKVTVKPDQIKISGAKQDLLRLDTLTTLPINIDGIGNTFTTLIPIDISDKNSLKFPVSSVQVVVDLANKKLNRTFRSVPVEVLGLSKTLLKKVELRPKYIDVEIAGTKQVIHKINPSEIRAYISGTDLEAGWQDKKIILKMPENVSLVKMLPDVISVHYSNE
ncbi:MAG: CdaR family protein [Bdellovibrionota bacterium]